MLGASGDLACLEAASGKRVWSVNVLSTFGGSNPRWGLSESPLVLSDRVLVNAGGPGASVVALDKKNGNVIWKSGATAPATPRPSCSALAAPSRRSSSPPPRRMGVDVKDGRLLWSYPRVANRVANIATPVVKDNFVFLSSDYGTGAALLKLDPADGGVTATKMYFSRGMMRNHHSGSTWWAITSTGFQRHLDGAALCRRRGGLEGSERGEGLARLRRRPPYLFSEGGVVGLAEATRPAIAKKDASRSSRPACRRGASDHFRRRLYLRDQDTIYAYDVRKTQDGQASVR